MEHSGAILDFMWESRIPCGQAWLPVRLPTAARSQAGTAGHRGLGVIGTGTPDAVVRRCRQVGILLSLSLPLGLQVLLLRHGSGGQPHEGNDTHDAIADSPIW